MVENYNPLPRLSRRSDRELMDDNLHSLPRRLIELRMEHADLDSLIDLSAHQIPADDLAVRRLKKRRLALRDVIAQLEAELDPPQPA
jgi:hypothetical protein